MIQPTGQVRWQREADGTAYPYLKPPGDFRWYRYDAPAVQVWHVPDNSFSKGFPTYARVVKLGWEVLPKSESSIGGFGATTTSTGTLAGGGDAA